MDRVFIFELPFDYTLYVTVTELLFCGVLLFVVLALTVKSFFVKVQGGREGLVGQSVTALDDFKKKGETFKGQVLCMGEIWNAVADFPLKSGDRSTVFASRGLLLFLSGTEDRNENGNNNL